MNSETRANASRQNGRRGGRPAERDAGRAKILALLEEHAGQEVPLPAILKLGVAQYGARILELRRAGRTIENRAEWREGKKYTWFKLVKGK